MAQRPSLLTSDTLMQSISMAMILAVVGRLFALGRGVLFARAMDPAALGTWALMINAIQVLAFVALLGVPSGLGRYVERYRREGRLSTVLLGLGLALLAVGVLLGTAGAFWHRPIGEMLFGRSANPALVGLTLLAVLAMAGLLAIKGVLNGLRLFRVDSSLELAQNIGFFVLACMAFAFWRRDAIAGASAFCAVTFLLAAGLGVYLIRIVRREEAQHGGGSKTQGIPEATTLPGNLTSWRVLMIYSLATWGAGSLQALWRYLDRYMLLHLGRLNQEQVLEQIGDYFIASKLAQPLTVVAGLLGVILLPHAVRFWEEHNKDEVARMIRLSAKLTGLGLTMSGAILIVLKRPALQIVVGRIPEDANVVMAPVVGTIVFLALFYVVRTYLLCGERVWVIAGIWCVALVANAGLNAVLIPWYGLHGAAIATLTTAALALLGTNWIAVRDGLKLDVGTWVACGLPAALLLPVSAMLMLATAVAGLLLWSGAILTAEEKQFMDTWASQRFPIVFAPARPIRDGLQPVSNLGVPHGP